MWGASTLIIAGSSDEGVSAPCHSVTSTHGVAVCARMCTRAQVGVEAGTGETELHLASQFGHTQFVEDLLESASYGFEVDAPGCGNASALMLALGNGYVKGGREGERWRVRGGWRLASARHGLVCLQHAELAAKLAVDDVRHSKRVSTCDRHVGTAQVLLKFGADVNHSDWWSTVSGIVRGT
jgi:hypothetical protein